MPSVKISALTEKTTMVGTEEVLINDSGISKKFSTQQFLDVKTAAETAQTAAELAETNVAANLVLTNADVVLAEADKVQTGLDRVATAADVVLAEADKVQTGLDRAAVAADLILTAADTVATAADKVATNADVVLTNADVVTSTAQAGIATTQASTATTQAGIATTKAGEASTSASAASTSASNASTSETNAGNSASSATTAQAAAEAARDSALASFDSFDDRYLGQKASDPTLDNDGDALVGGTLYFNSTSDAMMVYEGTSWVAAYASLSGALLQTNNLSDLNNAGTARTNLGVDAAGTVNYTHPTGAGNEHLPSTVSQTEAGYLDGVTSAIQTQLNAKLESVPANSVGASELNVTGNGTAGQYLGSDGDGTMTWTSISADPTMGGDLSGTASNAQIVANAVTDTELNSAKLNGIEAGATADQTNAEIKTAYEANANTNEFSDAEQTKLAGIATSANNYSHPANHAISVVTGLQTALDGKVDDSQVLTNVPSGAVFTDTTYTVGDGGLTEKNFTSADNTKLDGIEAGATADQTAAQILASLKTVDVNGTSGVNAGTCDGLAITPAATRNDAANKVVTTDASGYAQFGWINTTSGIASGTPTRIYCSEDTYLRYYTPASLAPYILNQGSTKNSHTHAYLPTAGGNMTGDITFGSNYGQGIVGLYSATKWQGVFSMGAAYKLDVNGATPSNLYGISWTHSNVGGQSKSVGHQACFMSNGITQSAVGTGIWSISNITAYSDERVKENLEVIPNALDKVKQLNGYTYNRTDLIKATPEEEDTIYDHNPNDRYVGVIAQEVLKVLPEAVTGGPNSNAGSKDDHYSVAYGNLAALFIEATKELSNTVDKLEARIKTLENK